MVTVNDAPAVSVTPPDFAELYRQHAPAIVRYLHRRLGDDVCEDAAAETFARAWQRREALRDPANGALPWLYGIAGNVVSERWRAERRRLKALERVAAHDNRSAEPAHERALQPRTIAALRRLPTTDREALLLVVWGELSYEETARAMGVPVGTVRSRINRARNRLGIDLNDLDPQSS